jgi:hypothetical protein
MAKKKRIIYRERTAVWLRENTKLTLKQIAEFCSMAVEEVVFANSLSPFDPRFHNISQEEIEAGEKNNTRKLRPLLDFNMFNTKRPKKKCQLNAHKDKKTPYFKYIIKNSNGRNICLTLVGKLLGRKVSTLLRELENPEDEIDALDPVAYELCSQEDLDMVYQICSCETCKTNF